jgi:hypothetical protein
MTDRHSPLGILIVLAAVCATSGAGCHALGRREAQGPGANRIPPFSSSPLAGIFTGAHAQAAPALRHELQLPPAPVGCSDYPAPPDPVGALPSLPATPAAAHPAPPAADARWREQVEQQTASTEQRVAALEDDLRLTREALAAVNQSLQLSQERIHSLQTDVTQGQAELRRFEEATRQQQIADLKSLDELAEALQLLLSKTQTAAKAQERAR